MIDLKFITILLILIVLGNTVVYANTAIDDIDEFEWENRIILVNATLDNNGSRNTELQTLLGQNVEIEDRDIIWFFISSKPNSSNQNEFNIQTNSTRKLTPTFKNQIYSLVQNKSQQIILIGKDGGIKSRSKTLNLSDLFSQIDMMPMRMLEMQQR